MPELSVVLTHGRDKPFEIPETLQRTWTDALRWGLQRAGGPDATSVPVDFAFYGDLWRPDTPPAGTRELTSEPEAGGDETVAAAIAADMVAAAGIPAPESATRDLAGPLAGPLAALDHRFHVGDAILRLFVTDLAQYFTNPALRVAVQDRVAARITAAGGPVALIAHSMGTFVSYDLLRRRPDLPVAALITCGAPLGLPSWRAYVAGADGTTPFPPALPRWFNIYNRSDFACIVPELAPLYPATDGRHVVDVQSAGQDSTLLNPMAGHDALVYLSSMALAGALRSVLDAPPTLQDAPPAG